MRRIPLVAAACFGILAPAPDTGAKTESSMGRWKRLEPGLEMGTFPAPRPSVTGDSTIRILRIDPERFDLRLANASAPGEGKLLTARQWCERQNLVAAINASMYQTDYKTSVSLMRSEGHVNNPRVSKDNSILAWGPKNPDLPKVMMIDRQKDDFERLKDLYRSLVQNIRVISWDGINVWQQQARRWSNALVGVDDEGRLLFIHVRSPYSVHDLAEMLLGLPIGIARAMYVEGGAQAQLYVGSKHESLELTGIPEGFDADDQAARSAWPIPNVIGIIRRSETERREAGK
ncbi:MAG TPA: phosphodiester glycosidase family protein [Candidatus Polarisedimenticolia bacterium]|nr:phosphodiester glycosidase family protein [Candidatus Polarisedimenticolia bacterium]